MPNPFIIELSQRAKVSVVVLSLFLMSFTLGMLAFGTTHNPDSLSADVIMHGSASLHHLTP